MTAPRSVVALAVCSLALVGCATSTSDPSSASSPDPIAAEATAPSPPSTGTTNGANDTMPTDRSSTDTTAGAHRSEPPGTPGPLPDLTIGPAVAFAAEPVDAKVRPGTEEVWVAERAGRIVRLGAPDDEAEPVHDETERITAGVEEGLLGLAFGADGDTLFVNTASEGETVVASYRIDPDGVVDPGTRNELLRFDQPYEAHNGGDLLIGPDDMLYVFTGDGGFIGDPDRVALDVSSPLGKVLRLDPRTGAAPSDNPFVDDGDAVDLVWALGLRNPWRASFDPSTGDLWIADVGDFGWEEINVARADHGAGRAISFGWSAFEGPDRFNEDQPASGHTDPWFAYRHGDGGRCSITGGERYRGDRLTALDGWYVFADFCDGVVRAIEVIDVPGDDPVPGREVTLGSVDVPVSIRPDADGGLLVVSIAGGIHPIVER